MTDEPRTYFEIEARASQHSDKPSIAVTGATVKPWGHDLPASSYGVDPTGPEPQLGIDVNELPDMEACLVPGAVSARALRAAADSEATGAADDLE
ncbi:hypothetical protein [Nitrobacter sp.]|jgi:hypothetical protein|uniref:hypothetical protein n=1 Tax=Nitrobacter sp. TaxID=29420 RepID=UPI003F64B5C6